MVWCYPLCYMAVLFMLPLCQSCGCSLYVAPLSLSLFRLFSYVAPLSVYVAPLPLSCDCPLYFTPPPLCLAAVLFMFSPPSCLVAILFMLPPPLSVLGLLSLCYPLCYMAVIFMLPLRGCSLYVAPPLSLSLLAVLFMLPPPPPPPSLSRSFFRLFSYADLSTLTLLV